jgi:hypothetical protein
VRSSSFVSRVQPPAWYVFSLLLCISFELTCSCSQSVAGAIYESSIYRNVLHGASLANSSTSTSLDQVPLPAAVSAFRVCESQDTARYLAILKLQLSCTGRLDLLRALLGKRSPCTPDSCNEWPVVPDVTLSLAALSLPAPNAITCIYSVCRTRHT